MIKKYIIHIMILIPSLFFISNTYGVDSIPSITCTGLPGCEDTNFVGPTTTDITNKQSLRWISNFIGELIKYVSVIAVISVMISGVLYMTSGGEEEKVKKAKNWIIWSLIGVFISISAWGIINMLNAIKIIN